MDLVGAVAETFECGANISSGIAAGRRLAAVPGGHGDLAFWQVEFGLQLHHKPSCRLLPDAGNEAERSDIILGDGATPLRRWLEGEAERGDAGLWTEEGLGELREKLQ